MSVAHPPDFCGKWGQMRMKYDVVGFVSVNQALLLYVFSERMEV